MKKLFALLLTLCMLLSFADCGGNDSKQSADNNTPKESASDSTGENASGKADEKEDDNTADFTLDIKEDDNTVVFTVGNITQVYTHDGDTITGYTTYTDCGDADTAKAVANSIDLSDSYYEGLGMKSAIAKGKYLVQEYTEEGFTYKSYNDLMEAAETYKKIAEQQ